MHHLIIFTLSYYLHRVIFFKNSNSDIFERMLPYNLIPNGKTCETFITTLQLFIKLKDFCKIFSLLHSWQTLVALQ